MRCKYSFLTTSIDIIYFEIHMMIVREAYAVRRPVATQPPSRDSSSFDMTAAAHSIPGLDFGRRESYAIPLFLVIILGAFWKISNMQSRALLPAAPSSLLGASANRQPCPIRTVLLAGSFSVLRGRCTLQNVLTKEDIVFKNRL